MEQNIYKESIIVIGPVGVGKTTVSRRLGEINRMPVIITDLLKHCPKDLGDVYLKRSQVRSRINELKDELEYKKCKTFEELSALVDDYMYNYNYTRKQWSKNKMTPIEYKNFLLVS